MAARSYHAWIVGLTVVVGCGGKKDEPKAKSEHTAPAPQEVPEPKLNLPAKQVKAVTAAPAVVEVPVVGVTIEAPGGATVTEDPPGFNEKASTGAVVAAGDFKLHLWKGTIGEARTEAGTVVGTIEGGKYTEVEHDVEHCIYTAEKDGVTTYGFFVLAGEHLLCGTAEKVANAGALEPYRAACKTVQPRK
jgi:hypothetical protein